MFFCENNGKTVLHISDECYKIICIESTEKCFWKKNFHSRILATECLARFWWGSRKCLFYDYKSLSIFINWGRKEFQNLKSYWILSEEKHCKNHKKDR